MFFAFLEGCSKFLWSSDHSHETIISLDSSNSFEVNFDSKTAPDCHSDTSDSVLLILFIEETDNLALNWRSLPRWSTEPAIESAFRYTRQFAEFSFLL